MQSSITSINPVEYDTSINVIGGLQDCSVIYKAIKAYFSDSDTLDDLVKERNELALRTERSRTRVQNAIEATFLNYKNEDHLALIKSIFVRDQLVPGWELILFWQYAISNRLFREISINVYSKAYYAGRAGISKEDIVAYLKEFLSQNKQLDLGWSESTVRTLSTKYLNLLTKLNLLEGARLKSFKHIRPSSEALVLFLYFASLHEPESKNILKNGLLPLSFIAPEDIQERMKKLSIKGYFNMTYNGVDLNIELIHGFKEIFDVLYN